MTTLVVRFTSLASSWIAEDSCARYDGFYRFIVNHNGAPIEETPEQKRLRKSLQNGDCPWGPGPARGGFNPGEHMDYIQHYNAAKPGTYQIAVEEVTVPDHPEWGLTIRSNTITFVVPKSEDGSASTTAHPASARN